MIIRQPSIKCLVLQSGLHAHFNPSIGRTIPCVPLTIPCAHSVSQILQTGRVVRPVLGLNYVDDWSSQYIGVKGECFVGSFDLKADRWLHAGGVKDAAPARGAYGVSLVSQEYIISVSNSLKLFCFISGPGAHRISLSAQLR